MNMYHYESAKQANQVYMVDWLQLPRAEVLEELTAIGYHASVQVEPILITNLDNGKWNPDDVS